MDWNQRRRSSNPLSRHYVYGAERIHAIIRERNQSRFAPAPFHAVLLLTLLLVGACATPREMQTLQNQPGDLPPMAQVVGVPFFAQEEYYCGPAAVAMTLAWTGLAVNQDDMVPQVYTPGRKGTLQPDVIAAARRNGRLAVPVRSLHDVLAEIAAGRPVLVFQNLALSWYPQWHYAVAIGYDLDRGEMVLHTGTYEARAMSMATFQRTWDRAGRWALVLLPPDTLPVATNEIEVLRAAAGIERAGRIEAAETAYATISTRWPTSFPALMGLGNTRYARKDPAGAETAFRQAIAAQPEAAAPAWNNLAYVLVELGRKDDAIAAAQAAVSLGGTDSENYQATLKELSGP